MVGGSNLRWVACSASQLKERSAWFYSDLVGAIDFSQFGQFHRETVVLKREARKGMLLSTTKEIVNLNPSEISYIDDIKRNGFTFSDGCGNISSDLAAEIDALYDLTCCSAYQVRIGGNKGVLVHEPTLDGRII